VIELADEVGDIRAREPRREQSGKERIGSAIGPRPATVETAPTISGGGLTNTKSTSESARMAGSRRQGVAQEDPAHPCVAPGELATASTTKIAAITPYATSTNVFWRISTRRSLLATWMRLSVPGGT